MSKQNTGESEFLIMSLTMCIKILEIKTNNYLIEAKNEFFIYAQSIYVLMKEFVE